LQEYLAALRAVDAGAGVTGATVEQLLKQGGEVVGEAGISAGELGAAPAAPDVSAALAAEVSLRCLLRLVGLDWLLFWTRLCSLNEMASVLLSACKRADPNLLSCIFSCSTLPCRSSSPLLSCSYVTLT
jgi:hypothetical protein